MTERYVSHYTTPLSMEDINLSLAVFESSGLVLENPTTGAASLLNLEGQIRTDPENVKRAIADASIGQHVTFQFWFPDRETTDVICAYSPLTDWLTVRQYWLDGLTPDEREHLISVVCSQVAVPSPRTIALVIDRRGAAEDTDWDTVVQERGKGDRYHADLFLMS